MQRIRRLKLIHLLLSSLQYAKLARDLQVPGGTKESETKAPPSGGNGDQQNAVQNEDEDDLSGLL